MSEIRRKVRFPIVLDIFHIFNYFLKRVQGSANTRKVNLVTYYIYDSV